MHSSKPAGLVFAIVTAGVLLAALGPSMNSAPAERETPPGVVVAYSPVDSGLYVGSPSLAKLPNGEYVASHDWFGPKSGEKESGRTRIFASKDRGATWELRSEVQGAFWARLFVHRGLLGLIGPEKAGGAFLLRLSSDGGRTWTQPTNEHSGLLRPGGHGSAPTPVISHNGRLWLVADCETFSVSENANLLEAASWKTTGSCDLPPALQPEFGGWGEGNAVVGPDGQMWNLLKVKSYVPGEDRAGLVRVSADGSTASADPKSCLVAMPGARIKFTVRFDPFSRRYLALTNYLPPADYGPKADLRRNTVALVSSPDLRRWQVDRVLLRYPDTEWHGLQYLDWQIEGDDLIAVCRTAWPDGAGGPNRQHDANYLTFHRFSRFREALGTSTFHP